MKAKTSYQDYQAVTPQGLFAQKAAKEFMELHARLFDLTAPKGQTLLELDRQDIEDWPGRGCEFYLYFAASRSFADTRLLLSLAPIARERARAFRNAAECISSMPDMQVLLPEPYLSQIKENYGLRGKLRQVAQIYEEVARYFELRCPRGKGGKVSTAAVFALIAEAGVYFLLPSADPRRTVREIHKFICARRDKFKGEVYGNEGEFLAGLRVAKNDLRKKLNGFDSANPKTPLEYFFANAAQGLPRVLEVLRLTRRPKKRSA